MNIVHVSLFIFNFYKHNERYNEMIILLYASLRVPVQNTVMALSIEAIITLLNLES